MKKTTLYFGLHFFAIVLISNIALAQVGINTTDPKGIVDFNSSISGVVYPNVALLATDNPLPVVNPQGGNLAPGTVVYNTNRTTTGLLTDVNPGIYVWDGSSWTVHFKKRQSELFNQEMVLRPQANFVGGFEDIPGLGISDTKTFTAKYSGLYRIEVKSYFGGGEVETNNSIFVSQASGQYRFLFDTSTYTFETSSFSAYSSYIASGNYYEDIWKETYNVYYVNLIAGVSYPFSLTFDAYDAPGFIGNGSTSAPIPPAPVDFINEDFEGSYTVDQDNITNNSCWNDGWGVYATGNRCTDCDNRVLYVRSMYSNCTQDATAKMSFTPTSSSVKISFDYGFREKTNKDDSFRVYLHDGTSQVGLDLVNIDNFFSTITNSSYNGIHLLTPGTTYTLRFEYINEVKKAYFATVDHVVVSGFTAPIPGSDVGRGYVGNEMDCQIEFTYIGE